MSTPHQAPDPTLRLLIVSGQTGDVDLLLERLAEGGGRLPERAIVANAASMRAAIHAQAWDAVLYLHGTPGFTAVAALKIVQARNLDLPFIIVASPEDEKVAVRAMKSGAHDVVSTNRLERLLPAVEREVREARHRADHRAALEMLRASEARFRALASNLPGMLFQLRLEQDGSLRFLYVSEGCQKLFGLKQHELLASTRRFFDALEAEDRAGLEKAIRESAGNGTLLNWEGRFRSRSRTKWINLRSTPHKLEDGTVEWQGIITNISHSKEIESELRRSREQLSELSFHLEAAKEEERERIARDIHDELGSMLVALKIDAALLASKLPAAPASLREKAHAIEDLLNRAMSTASRVARELRPGILKEFGLPAAIECQAEDFSQRFGIPCRIQCDDEAIQPDADTSLAIFRIVQEALTNVAKHAHASLVVVRLRRERGRIALEIRDNGRGVSEADLNKPKSFGLRGIRERVHSLAGEFSLLTGEQGGTHISLRVPEHRGSPPIEAEEDAQRKLF